jgi:regulator of replication initiation timing
MKKSLIIWVLFLVPTFVAAQTKKQIRAENVQLKMELQHLAADHVVLGDSIVELHTEALRLKEVVDGLREAVNDLRNRNLRHVGENYALRDSIKALNLRLVSMPRPKTNTSIRTATANTSPAKTTPRTTTAYRMRCQAITKAGHQCKRYADAGSRYCWQHH